MFNSSCKALNCLLKLLVQISRTFMRNPPTVGVGGIAKRKQFGGLRSAHAQDVWQTVSGVGVGVAQGNP